jgi:putative ABC transport system permease protein
MRNPLIKRLPRELLKDITKYIVLFFLMTIPIAFISGYMVANDSMIRTYYNALEKYNAEDGHFISSIELQKTFIETIEEDNNITIYNLSYKEIESSSGHNIRVYNAIDRDNINKYCIHKGNLPTKSNEIALDRLYMENNNIEVGDTYTISNIDYIVTSKISLIDYSTLFKNNTDTMFDANKFSIALVSNDMYDKISNDTIKYSYAYTFKDTLSKEDTHDKNTELSSYLYKKLLESGNRLDDFLSREDNQAMTFAIEDIEGDMVLIFVLGILLVVGLSFVFALLSKSQIEKDAKSIGTLKAMGYNRWELLSGYLILPTVVTFIAAIFGNIISYTCMKSYIAEIYYHSYSLPLYNTFYNAKAMILTTILPLVIVFIINLLIIFKTISLPALNLLRNEIKTKKNKKVIKLSKHIKFINRFQLRTIIQNIGTYIALLFGTLFSTMILLFGLMLNPLLDKYKEEIVESQIAPYQTILKSDIDVDNGEKFYIKTINYKNDEIMVYGIEKYGNDSLYLKNLDLSGNNIIISNDLKAKYKIKNNTNITLTENYTNNLYNLKVTGSYDTTGSLIIFMNYEMFKDTFDSDYLTSYFSKEKLNISDEYVYKTITLDDLTVASDQLTNSLGKVFWIYISLSIILYILITYLLSKIVIEKNQSQISMLKIIGYRESSINRIYNISSGIMLALTIIISTIISKYFIKVAWDIVLRKMMKGWINFYVAPYLYPLILFIGVLSYGVVYLIESRRISKIDLSLAIKDDNL